MKLQLRLFLSFLILSIIPLVLASIFAIQITETIITREIYSQLDSVATIHKHRIRELLGDDVERLNYLINVSRLPVLYEGALNNVSTSNESFLSIQTIIDLTQENSEIIEEISILDITGIGVLSTDPTLINHTFAEYEFFQEVISKNKISIFRITKEDGILHGYHGAPIKAQNDTLIGILEIKTTVQEIIGVIMDYTGLKNTGEAVLAQRKSNGDALFIMPLRFDDQAALNRTIPFDDTEVPIIQALAQQEGFFTQVVDYRGEPVLASTRHLNYLGIIEWGLVVKIDRNEAFLPLSQIYQTIWVNLVVILAVISAASFFVSNIIVSPITHLSEIVKQIQGGDFDDPPRAIRIRNDEIGFLAESFNEMTDSLLKERASLEQRVKERNIELEQSNRDLEQFAYVASHDLQEPLRMISGFLQLLERQYGSKLDIEGKEYIKFAVDGAHRMSSMINALLDYGRVDSKGGLFVVFNLHEIISEIEDDLSRLIEESNTRIYSSSLPEELVGDPIQIKLVLQNLISNSIKFKSEKPPEIWLSCSHYRIRNEWRFKLADNGIGIDSRYSSKVFSIFQRLHTQSEYPGTGIGLALCKRIVERHGGQIWFESEGIPGKGTIFHFTLPLGDFRSNLKREVSD